MAYAQLGQCCHEGVELGHAAELRLGRYPENRGLVLQPRFAALTDSRVSFRCSLTNTVPLAALLPSY